VVFQASASAMDHPGHPQGKSYFVWLSSDYLYKELITYFMPRIRFLGIPGLYRAYAF
jgi:hypothetical protein